MKNIDFKKLLVLLVIIAVAVVAIVGVTKLFSLGGPSKKEQEKIENQIIDYFSKASSGYSSIYNGVDLLYDNDKVEVKDLSQGAMIEVAIMYADDNDINIFSDSDAGKVYTEKMKVNAVAYNAEELRKIVKELFDVELPKQSIDGGTNFLYNYLYIEPENTYLKVDSGTYNLNVEEQAMDFYVISTKKKKGNYISRVAVAYTYCSEDKCAYAKDKNGSTIVEEEVDGLKFPKDKVDEFTKYDFTTKKVDGKYVLVSVEKVK